MQLQFLQHHQIDKNRWLNTIQQSVNGLIYAWPQYLNAVSPGWLALVNEDYTLVMPLTIRIKWGIRYLYQPAFCQQSGIFGTATIDDKVTEKFLSTLQQHISFAEIQLNYKNFSAANKTLPRKNYVLSLANSYEEISKGYNQDLIKKNLQRSKKFSLQFSITDNVKNAIQVYAELYGSRTPQVGVKDYTNFATLCNQLVNSGNAFVAEVHLPKGELLACGIFLKDHSRIYNVASSTLPNGRTLEANHFLIDQLIRRYAGTGLLLDFEGSEIPGIERFYQKFGAINQPYYFAKWNKLSWPLRLLKK